MRWMWGWIAALPLLAACGEKEPAKLADLKGLRLEVNVNPFDKSYVQRFVYLELGHDGTRCVTLSDEVKAFVNDVEVPLVLPGGVDEDTGNCHLILFALESEQDALPFPTFDEGLNRIRITDGETHLQADFANLCTPRSYALRTPADGVLRPGDDVDIEWLPATDELVVDAVEVSASGRFVQLHAAKGELRTEGNHVRLQWPQLPSHWNGPATLSLKGATETTNDPFRNPPQRCEGFTSCQADCAPERQYSLSVQLGS
ncbi:hypothetical protein ACLESD_13425 [Pyxidicoccus sp. 3LFB2]